MPRFSMKLMLILFAVAALWLSTFAGYLGDTDVRSLIMLSICVVAALRAYCLTGRARVFWLGFLAAMYLTISLSDSFRPTFESLRKELLPSDSLGFQIPARLYGFWLAMYETVLACVFLMFATVMAYIGAYTYDQTRKPADN